MAKKRLSQHFLRDPGVLNRIADAAGLSPGAQAVEIGAGSGGLTRVLAERVRPDGRIAAVEIDGSFIESLKEMENVEVVHADILKTPLPTLLKAPGPVIGNLPYHITTPVLEWLVQYRSMCTSATIMAQREFARRAALAPGEKGCGSISVFVHYYFEVKTLFDVGPGAFTPRPKVWSTVFQLTPLEKPRAQPLDEELFFAAARAAFGQRRKTLRNALKSRFPHRIEALREAGIDDSRRGETLSMEELRALADALCIR